MTLSSASALLPVRGGGASQPDWADWQEELAPAYKAARADAEVRFRAAGRESSGVVRWHYCGPGALFAAALLLACLCAAAAAAVLGRGSGAQGPGDAGDPGRDTPPALRRRVDALYTFGAPGISREGLLVDGFSASGCFPGLRTYCIARRLAGAGEQVVSDPVSWITAQFDYVHPMMPSMAVGEDDVLRNSIANCSAESNLPPRDDFWWTTGHTAYESVMQAHVELLPNSSSALSELSRVYAMSHFSFAVYYKLPQKIAMDAADWGWNLVGFSALRELSPGGLSRLFAEEGKDSVALYQNEETLQCVLAFEGTNLDDSSDWISDADAMPKNFCGIASVHEGFRNKLLRTVLSNDYQDVIKTRLPRCDGVLVTGHSLGGAQAALFAACANRQRSPDARFAAGSEGHYGAIAWVPRAPAKLRPFLAAQPPRNSTGRGGSLLRNRGVGLCLDVKGSMTTADRSDVVLYPCESSGGTYSKDQRWRMTEAGALVNELSDLCMDVDGIDRLHEGGAFTIQQRCGEGPQRWSFTPEGFLLNAALGKCVDSKMAMYDCPFSDQRWRRFPNGSIVNERSGLCLGVDATWGRPEDAPLVVVACAAALASWALGAGGVLAHAPSGLCVHATLSDSGSARRLVLGGCGGVAAAASFAWMEAGFLRNGETGYCLDVAGTSPVQGSRVVLARCEHKTLETSGLWKLSPDGFLVNLGSDFLDRQSCVEVVGQGGTIAAMAASKLRGGAKLHLDICKFDTDQRWSFEDGRLRNELGGRKCLQMKSAAAAPTADLGVWIRNCAEWLAAGWAWTEDGGLRSEVGDRCVGIGTDERGHYPSAMPCGDPGAPLASWSAAGGAFVDRASDQCLTHAGDPNSAGVLHLRLEPCKQGTLAAPQQWSFEGGQLRARSLPASCAILDDAGRALVLAIACPRALQEFELSEAGQLRNNATARCFDATESAACSVWQELTGGCVAGAGGGWKLAMSPCDASRENQRWERVGP